MRHVLRQLQRHPRRRPDRVLRDGDGGGLVLASSAFFRGARCRRVPRPLLSIRVPSPWPDEPPAVPPAPPSVNCAWQKKSATRSPACSLAPISATPNSSGSG